MKLPKALFVIINPVVSLLLRSPIHRFWSGSLLLITFKGKKSNRYFTTPVRYVEVDGIVRCFSTPEGLWWRNLRGGAKVKLRVKGEENQFDATVIEHEPQRIGEGLEHYLKLFPQDAAYHSIKLNGDKSPDAADLDQASKTSIMVEARKVAPPSIDPEVNEFLDG